MLPRPGASHAGRGGNSDDTRRAPSHELDLNPASQWKEEGTVLRNANELEDYELRAVVGTFPFNVSNHQP